MDYYHQDEGALILPPPPRIVLDIDKVEGAVVDDIPAFIQQLVDEINSAAVRDVELEITPEPQTDPPIVNMEPEGDEEKELVDLVRETVDGVVRKVFEELGFTGNMRGVIAFKKYPLAPEGKAWDGAKERAAADVDDLKLMCSWFDSENADVKSAYKLPHHQASNKYTVWNGVKAAMGALLGARGGVQGLSASDRRGVYTHLSKHYKEFQKTPPEFRNYDEEELKRLGNIILIEPEDASGTDGQGEPVPEPKKRVDFGKLYDDVLTFDKKKVKPRPNLGRVLED